MFPELVVLGYLATKLRGRLAEVRADERGNITETVVLTALMALLAISVGILVVLGYPAVERVLTGI